MKLKRNFSHLTPRYIYDRTRTVVHERRFPDHPWLTSDSIALLSTLIKPTDTGIEFGSGRSTVWFAQRLKHLISVEHNDSWYNKVEKELSKCNLSSKVDYHFSPTQASYLKPLNELQDCSVDFCLVDGLFRDECALTAIEKLKSGSLLVIDNVNRYLPNDETLSPNSRCVQTGCASKTWEKFTELTLQWRYIWTTNGVTDTGIWLKPFVRHGNS